MTRAFTLIETRIIVAIVGITASIVMLAIPGLLEKRIEADRKRAEEARALIGQTISIRGAQCLINDYADGKYKVIILGSPAIPIEMTKEAADAAYAEYTKNHAEAMKPQYQAEEKLDMPWNGGYQSR
jgi:hypothetical protein